MIQEFDDEQIDVLRQKLLPLFVHGEQSFRQWLTLPMAKLAGRNPIQAIRDGHFDQVDAIVDSYFARR